MKKAIFLMALLLCLCAGAAQSQDNQAPASPEAISALRVALEQALGESNLAPARQIAHKVLQAAAARADQPLSAEEQYAVGLAHLLLAAEWLEKATQSGQLPAEQAARAQEWLAKLLPPRLIVIGQGERVELEKYIPEGKTTIVDFYSEYCPPCRALSPRLEKLAQSRPDIFIIKVDINRPGVHGIDWQSPVAQQFQLRSIPHIRIYGPNKQLQVEGREAYMQILQWIEAVEK